MVKVKTKSKRSKSQAAADKAAENGQQKSIFSSEPKTIFSKLDIDIDAMTKTLHTNDEDFDKRSSVTHKSLRGLGVKKKDKAQLRKGIWMKKMENIEVAKKAAKEKAKREKTAVVGDMKPLADTLPTLEMLLRDMDKPQANPNSKKNESSGKSKAILKEKKRKKEQMSDITAFHQVLGHPAFKSNPLATISEHLSNKMKHEESMET